MSDTCRLNSSQENASAFLCHGRQRARIYRLSSGLEIIINLARRRAWFWLRSVGLDQDSVMAIARIEPEDYLRERVDGQIQWMADKARHNKSNYRLLRLTQICLGILVTAAGPYTTRLEYGPQITTALGAIISLAAAWEAVNDYQNNWIRYRRTLEDLERERLLYQTASGPYRPAAAASSEQEAAFALFVTRVEALLGQELDSWSTSAVKSAGANGAAVGE